MYYIGFNHNVASMNIDQIISEYITKSDIFYRETESKKYFEKNKLNDKGIQRINLKQLLNQYRNNEIVAYQNLAIPQIQKSISKMENILLEDINESMEKSEMILYILSSVGFITLIYSIYFAYSQIHKVLNDSEELVNVIFNLYLNSNTTIPDFKANN